MKEPKKYVLTISKKFLVRHPKSGQPTGFVEKIKSGKKIHTMRGNYALWAKRIAQINAGKAVLCVRYWTGRPYHKPQKEFLRLTKVGIQKVEFTDLGWFIDDKDSDVTTTLLAKNDGLDVNDFKAWFKGKITEPMAIIHFTDFRY